MEVGVTTFVRITESDVGAGDTSSMDRLDQLVARSQREIEAHTHELGDTDSGRYFITEASHLLAALRLWAQSQYRTDHVVRDILEAGDVVALHDVSRELQEIGTHDAQSAGWSITTITNRSSGELMTIGSYALRAL
jgi:hypothetical protein